MSTPTPDEPTAERATAPAASEESPPPAPTAAPAAPAPAGPPPASPFVPIYREPWVNPARRRHVAGIGAAALVVALGAGVGIGWAISGDHHRERMHPGVVMFPARVGGLQPGGFGPHGQLGGYPGYQPGNGGNAAPIPVPAPSSTG